MSAGTPGSAGETGPAETGPAETGPDGAATLRRRLRRGLAAAAAVLVAALAVTGWALVRVTEAQDLATGPYFQAVVEADRAAVTLLDAEVAVRAYLTTGQRVALEPYVRALDTSDTITVVDPATFAELGADPGLLASYSRAEDAVRDWVSGYASPQVQAVRGSGQTVTDPDVLAQGTALFREARSATAALGDDLRADRAVQVDRLDRWNAVLVATVVALVLLAVLTGVVLWRYLDRWVTRPVDRLARDVRAVSSGDLEHPVAVTDGPSRGRGEIAALAADVEQMRQALVRQVEEIRTSHAEVERAHDQLAEQAAELERSNRDLEQFAYVASHDLQEPLRKVASFTQLLQKRYGGQLDERADQYIEFAVDGAKRMQRLIQDLLGFSRVGRTGSERVDVPLEDALAQALDDLEGRVQDTGGVVTHDPLPVVRGERALLVQMFVNLVGNSLKFRDPERAPQVHVGARVRGTQVELWCRDNGIGIDAQYADRVFVIFQRLHPKDVYSGTGIGLALVKRIVEYHGGRIGIEATEGGGTTVRWTLAHVVLPEAEGEPAGEAAGVPEGQPAPGAAGSVD